MQNYKLQKIISIFAMQDKNLQYDKVTRHTDRCHRKY